MSVKHHSICFNLSQARGRVNVAGRQCMGLTTPHPTVPFLLLLGRLEMPVSPLFFLCHSKSIWAHLRIASQAVLPLGKCSYAPLEIF